MVGMHPHPGEEVLSTPDTRWRTGFAVAAIVTATACQSPAGTAAAAPPEIDAAAIAGQFSSVIWPATVDYHYHRAQNGPENLRWLATVDGSLDRAGYTALRQAVSDLGEVATGPGTSGGVEDLRLGTVSVAAATDTEATVAACYTFTALSYTIESGWDAIRTPAAAQADFSLVHNAATDTWRLHAITGQHPVSGC